jgi:threonyl-tRNA synthetase
VADEYAEYLEGIVDQLRSHRVRAEVDRSDDRMQKKIRNHTKAKIPFQLIAGEEDRAAGTVSFRFRDGSQKNGVPVDEAVRRIVESIETRAQVETAWLD